MFEAVKLEYMKCNAGDLHEGEQLNFVCLESTCKDIGLICPVCRSQKHIKHRVVPLKVFLNDIQTILNEKSKGNQIETLLSQSDTIHHKMLSLLKDAVQKMALQIKHLEEQINTSHKNARSRLLEQNNVQMNFPQVFEQIITNQYNSLEALKQDIRRIIENVSLSTGKFEIEFKPQKVFEQFNTISTDFISSLGSLSQSFKSQIVKMNKQLDRNLRPANKTNYTISQTMKSISISVQDKVVTQTITQNYDNRFVLIEPALHESSRIQFKVTNLANFIGFGVALKNILTEKNFKFDYNHIGHGTYMMSCNGYSWSHSRQEDNVAQKNVKFGQGDIIQCDYLPDQKLIQFINKTSKDQVPHKLIVEVPEGEEVYFCINLCSQNDKAEIFDEPDN